MRATNASVSSAGSADDIVAHAEDVVRDTWLLALRGECDYTGAQMHAASARCDVARRNLVAARLGRAPEAIAVAYAALEGALVSARIAARAYTQAREALAQELGLADRQADEQFLDDYASGGRMPAKAVESPSVRGSRRPVRALLALGWLPQHVVSSLVRLAADFPAARRL
jgi:hypothetical protein